MTKTLSKRRASFFLLSGTRDEKIFKQIDSAHGHPPVRYDVPLPMFLVPLNNKISSILAKSDTIKRKDFENPTEKLIFETKLSQSCLRRPGIPPEG